MSCGSSRPGCATPTVSPRCGPRSGNCSRRPGYRAREWHTLADYFTSPGFSTERIHIFLARGIEPVAGNGYQRRDEEKFIVADWVPLEEAMRLVLAGKLHNGPAITGILAGYAACAGGFSGLRPATAPET